MTISMAMFFDDAARILNSKNRVNDVRQIVRRPTMPEKVDRKYVQCG